MPASLVILALITFDWFLKNYDSKKCVHDWPDLDHWKVVTKWNECQRNVRKEVDFRIAKVVVKPGGETG